VIVTIEQRPRRYTDRGHEQDAEREPGPPIREYLLALGLIAVAAIVVLSLFGGTVSKILSTVSGSV
jgi:hypothetical protein